MSPDSKTALNVYQALLAKWQRTINLVAPDTLADAASRHFDDSLQLLPLLPETPFVLADLGSGAGFPGLVLAIARPDATVHLVESDSRKSAFLSTVSRETGCKNVKVHPERVEKVLDVLTPDVVTARALASLDRLLAMTQVWWEANPALVLVFPKGAAYAGEVESARKTYAFDLDVTPSRTDKQAAILVIRNVKSL